MIIDLREPKTMPYDYPMVLIDANGKKVESNVVWVNTETGRVIYHKYDGINPVLSEDQTEVVKEATHVPAPISVVPGNGQAMRRGFVPFTLEMWDALELEPLL